MIGAHRARDRDVRQGITGRAEGISRCFRQEGRGRYTVLIRLVVMVVTCDWERVMDVMQRRGPRAGGVYYAVNA